jgi:hypothetical protein
MIFSGSGSVMMSETQYLVDLCGSATGSVAGMHTCPIYYMSKLNSSAEDFLIDTESLRLPSGEAARLSNELHNSRPVVRYPRFVSSMPLEWVAAACKLPGKAVQVALAIWDLKSLNRSPKVLLTQKQLEIFGVLRHAAYRALRQLEAARLVIVERKSGRAPRVTVNDHFLMSKSQTRQRTKNE